MKELTQIQSIIFLVGGAMMVAGAGLYVLLLSQHVACWIFLVGAVLFAMMQAMQLYEGQSLTLRRLKRIQLLADLLFVLSGLLMVDSSYRFLLSAFEGGQGYINYLTYIYNKWVILLLIASLLEVYTTHRISTELKKEKNNKIEL